MSARGAAQPRRTRRAASRVERGGAPAGERETLGLYLTGHPIGRFESGLPGLVSHRIGDLISDRPIPGLEPGRFGGGKPVTVAGLIDEVKKRGPRVILTLDDRTGRIEVTLFEEIFQKHRDLIAKDALVLVEGSCASMSSATPGGCRHARITELDKVREQQARRLVMPLHGTPSRLLGAPGRRSSHRGGRDRARSPSSTAAARPAARLTSGSEWTVRASRELLEQLEALVGRGRRAGACTAGTAGQLRRHILLAPTARLS